MRGPGVTQGHIRKGHRLLILPEECGSKRPFSRIQLEGI
ncbi:hypothetical protein TBK1r_12080 [Stieleria magnilauensis]|uniref:Uncharacterized protein n=1 Tax=Stieleria magnilauensis TaxID=2527963 RepID=A0ABX5XLL7_9BACT|nr:hypothetical protein TBK1r_12080 [Planctomycetes bacterium TBK1r]